MEIFVEKNFRNSFQVSNSLSFSTVAVLQLCSLVRQPTCTAPTGCISPIHLRVDIHDAHLATLNHVLHGVCLDPVQMLLVLPKLDELVPHDLGPHVVLLDKVETVGVLVRVCLPCRVWGGQHEGEGEDLQCIYIRSTIINIMYAYMLYFRFVTSLCPYRVIFVGFTVYIHNYVINKCMHTLYALYCL